MKTLILMAAMFSLGVFADASPRGFDDDPGAYCIAGAVRFPLGTVRAADGCNTCWCMRLPTGEAAITACTRMHCVHPPPRGSCRVGKGLLLHGEGAESSDGATFRLCWNGELR